MLAISDCFETYQCLVQVSGAFTSMICWQGMSVHGDAIVTIGCMIEI